MPYFVNCPRCNDDNCYTKLGEKCVKCNGSGRDWRGDDELKSYHSWAEISIEDLERDKVLSVENYGKISVFTYQSEIPNSDYTIEEEVRDIRESLGLSEQEHVSQIFCTHKWVSNSSSGEEECEHCGKTRLQSQAQKSKRFSYDKSLHDIAEYFPNRCYACEEYANTTSDNGNPMNGADKVYCNIGGIVRADEGCDQFKPDATAECDSCWNFSRNKDGAAYHCDVQGKLANMVWGRCAFHVEKDDVV